MKYTTEEYSELLEGRLPCSTLEFELCDKLIDLKRELASNTEIIGSVSVSFPSKNCDEACYYHCTKGGQQPPDCVNER